MARHCYALLIVCLLVVWMPPLATAHGPGDAPQIPAEPLNAAVMAEVPKQMGPMEYNVDRPGNDYQDFDLPHDSAQLCEDLCAGQADCKAWTYVKPGTTQGSKPRCWLKNAVPDPVSNNCCVSGVKKPALPPPPPPPAWDWNVDRPGNDYVNFDLPSSDPQLCLDLCAGQADCKAWTYVKPGTTQGAKPRCWLKNAVPDPVPNNCCVSGVKAVAPPPPPAMDWNVDRPGNDYVDFTLPSSDPQLCLDLCVGQPNCKAWSYVKPGTTQGSQPRCWLKNAVPDPVPDTCCVSGVKAVAAPPPPPPPPAMEWNVDRPGKNFTHFVLAQADPQLCLKECADRPNCVAWTYVKPNTTQGLKPLCWLKNAVPDPVPDNCCVSGVIK